MNHQHYPIWRIAPASAGLWVSMLIPFTAAAAQSGPFTVPTQARMVVRPSVISLAPGEEMVFSAMLMPARLRPAELLENVAWSVNGIPGGNDTVGVIDATGHYRAPLQAPVPHEIHIQAESTETINRYAWATALVGSSSLDYGLTASWQEPIADGGSFKAPQSLALDVDGNLLIADERTSKVWRYTTEGERLGAFGAQAEKPGRGFEGPCCVSVGPDQRVYVADVMTGPPRIQVLDAIGNILHGFGVKGAKESMALNVRGIGFFPDGRICIADFDNMRINLYDHDGTYLGVLGLEGTNARELNGPYGIVVDPNGDMFLLSRYGPSTKLTDEGEVLAIFAHPEQPGGPLYFHDIAGDRWGNVYVASRGAGDASDKPAPGGDEQALITKYNNEGMHLATWALSEKDRQARGVAVGQDGKVYVLFKSPSHAGVEVFAPK